MSVLGEYSNDSVINENILIYSNICDKLCSQCSSAVMLQNDSQRENLNKFLSSSFDERRILSHYQQNKELFENALATLTRLIINRECNILLNEKKTTGKSSSKTSLSIYANLR